jgi:hypothetical protein
MTKAAIVSTLPRLRDSDVVESSLGSVPNGWRAYMSRRELALMAEVGDTFPVWERTPGEETGELDPETSGLSEQLIQELFAWNAHSQELLFSEAPIENKYDYEKEFDQWTKEGRSLAKRIEIELGHEIDVNVTHEH